MLDPVLSLIGHTPLIRLKKIEEAHELPFELYGKLEKANPSGSIKDRAALKMIEEAERKGLLKEGSRLVEATSGNMGISLALIGARKGYRVRIYMPDSASKERRLLIAAYGAEIVLTPGKEGMRGSNEAAAKAVAEEGAVWLKQFDNPANSLAHYETTGPELAEALGGKIDALFAGFGTGGTISGIARYFKERGVDARIFGIEPAESPLLSEGKAGPHRIEGIGANFVPAILEKDMIDEVVDVKGADAFRLTSELAEREGLLVGISSGAALAGCLYRKEEVKKGGRAVVILPDGADRYLSIEGLYGQKH